MGHYAAPLRSIGNIQIWSHFRSLEDRCMMNLRNYSNLNGTKEAIDFLEQHFLHPSYEFPNRDYLQIQAYR